MSSSATGFPVTRARRWATLVAFNWRISPVRFCLLLATMVVSVIGQPLTAVLLREVTNAVVGGHHTAALRASVATAVVYSANNQVYDVRHLLRDSMRSRIRNLLDPHIFALITDKLKVQHMEDPHSLDRIEAIAGRGGEMTDSVWSAADLIGSALTIAATLFVLSTVSPLLLITLPAALPTLWLNRVGQARVRKATQESAEVQRTADQLLEKFFDPTVAVELRVTGAGPVLLDAYQQRWQRATLIVGRARTHASVLLALGWLIFLLGFCLMLSYTASRLAHGQATVGDLILILAIARQQQQMLQAVVFGYTRMTNGKYLAEAYWWLSHHAAENTCLTEPKPVPERLTHGITLDDVSFTYPGTNRTILDGITVELPAGSIIALVGRHGCGKTSLIKLLTGMYTPTAGAVLVDGQELDASTLTSWLAHITCGFQEFARFQTLTREAVGVGDVPSINDLHEVNRAIDQGRARSVVDQLDRGLETQLGTAFDGIELSGGQWQKLALARTCMLPDPLLVVLDEPTASLDPRSEYEVFQQHVAQARQLAERHGTITVIVSHRFSTVRMADRILVLSGGAVTEQGDHDELMAHAGEYARMYTLQKESHRA